LGVGEAVAPEVQQWAEVATVRSFESGEILCAAGVSFRGEFDARKIKAAEQFGEEDADGSPVEVSKRVKAEEASFGKGEELEGEVNVIGGSAFPAGLKIEHVVAQEHGQLMRGGRSQRADSHFHGAPVPGPLGREIAADAGVEFREETFIERSRCEFFGQ